MGRFDRFKERYDKLPLDKRAELIKKFSIARRQEIMEVEKTTDYLDTLIMRKYGFLLLRGRDAVYRTILNSLLPQVRNNDPTKMKIGDRLNCRELDDDIAVSLLGIDKEAPPPAPEPEPLKPPVTELGPNLYEIGRDEVDIMSEIINKNSPLIKYIKVTMPNGQTDFYIRENDRFYTFNPDSGSIRMEFVAVKGMRIELLPSFLKQKRLKT